VDGLEKGKYSCESKPDGREDKETREPPGLEGEFSFLGLAALRTVFK
jgi:hypothetical protein